MRPLPIVENLGFSTGVHAGWPRGGKSPGGPFSRTADRPAPAGSESTLPRVDPKKSGNRIAYMADFGRRQLRKQRQP